MAEAPLPSDSLIVEIDILNIEADYDGQVDRVIDYEARIMCLEELVEEIDSRQELVINPNLPTDYALTGIYPNPFNSQTIIEYQLPKSGIANISVYDTQGRLVKSLIKQEVPAGRHRVIWNVGNESTGIYFCRYEAGGFSGTAKLVLVK